METCEEKIDLKQVKYDLLSGIYASSQRGLKNSAKWLAELNNSISHVKLSADEYPRYVEDFGEEYDAYLLSKTYFDVKEYKRCSFFIKDCVTPKAQFLYLYSCYLALEKSKLDNMTDATCPPDPSKNSELKQLYCTIKTLYNDKKLDGYCLYLYGVILKKLDMSNVALDVFIEAVNREPLNWSAWQELALIIPNKTKLNSLELPDHWIKQFFLAYAYLEQFCAEEALKIYDNIKLQGFGRCSYLKAQRAIMYNTCKGLFTFTATNFLFSMFSKSN